MQIEKLRHEDLPQAIVLLDALLEMQNDPNACAARYREMEGRDDLRIFVAKDEGGRIVGMAMGIVCPSLGFDGRPFLVVEDVIVAEDCRRGGVGRRLFEALDDFAISRSCGYAILVSSPWREAAHAFYHKMGYSGDVRGFRKGYGH